MRGERFRIGKEVRHAFGMGGSLALVVALLAATGPFVGPSGPSRVSPFKPAFEWTALERTEDSNHNGLQDWEDPDLVSPLSWHVLFVEKGWGCRHALSVVWMIDEARVPGGACSFTWEFPSEGRYRVTLTATDAEGRFGSSAQTVLIQDWLIVSLGDSVASGEGNRPWTNKPCHRSRAAGSWGAARLGQDHDTHTTVTLLHLACTGATLDEGLLGNYKGNPPQITDVEERIGGRQIDALLISVGANDIGFGDVVFRCGFKPFDCRKSKVAKFAEQRITKLPAWYLRLDACIVVTTTCSRETGGEVPRPLGIPANRVYMTEYFDPTRDDKRRTCSHVLGISHRELEWAQEQIIGPLNDMVRKTGDFGWNVVGGIAHAFGEHGYCAHASWMVHFVKTTFLKRNHLGTLHPNVDGQNEYRNKIWDSLERDFYPGGEPRWP